MAFPKGAADWELEQAGTFWVHPASSPLDGLRHRILMKSIIAAAALLFASASAFSAYTLTITQNGPDVEATGSGTIDLTGLTYVSTPSVGASINASLARVFIGFGGFRDVYSFPPGGPTSMGTGGFNSGGSVTGDGAGIHGAVNQLFVPPGYVSGSPLANATARWPNKSLADMQLTPGNYSWTWAGDSFSLEVVAPPVVPGVPSSTSSIPMLSEWGLIITSAMVGLMAFFFHRRRR